MLPFSFIIEQNMTWPYLIRIVHENYLVNCAEIDDIFEDVLMKLTVKEKVTRWHMNDNNDENQKSNRSKTMCHQLLIK